MRRPLEGVRLVCGALLLALPVSAPAAAQHVGPQPADTLDLTLENIHVDRSGPSSAVIAPAGDRIAVTASGEDGRGIYLLQTANGAGATARWWSAGGSPVWSPDGERIAFQAEGDLWIAPAGAPDAVVRLTTGLSGVRDASFSPDGGRLAFYSSEGGAQDIWLVAADGSGAPQQLTNGAAALDDPRFEPAWSPDSRTIAYVSNAADYWMDDLWLVDVASGEATQLTRALMASSTPVWSPDGKRIALMGTAKDEYWYQDLSYLYVVDAERPGSEHALEMQVYATDGIMRHRPYWSGDGERLYFPYMQRGAYDLWSVPAAGGVATRVTNLGGSLSSLTSTRGADRFAFVRSGPTVGPEVYMFDAAGGPALRLTALSSAWLDLVEPIEVAYRSFDGLYVQGFLYEPPQSRRGSACPALVQVHGGGTNSYLNRLNLTEQYLASRGYVVLAINYRGGSGFGREFQDLAIEDWLGDQALDAGAAADYLRRMPIVNGRVGIYGGSYGGSMSLAAATRTPDKFDAAVAMRGAYSKTRTLAETDRLGKIFTITGHGGTPEERPDSYRSSETLDRLGQLKAPVLLLHGEQDRRVPFLHYEFAVAELERLGKEFDHHSYPTEGHGFRDPANRVDMYRRLEQFFERHLGICER